MGYLKDMIRGIKWMGGLRVAFRIFGFLKIAILARILTPSQFGLFGIASLALSFLEIITETGINIFFIQKGGKIKDYLDTAWVISIIRGFLISLLIFLSASEISSFFNSPDSSQIIRYVSIVPLIRGFINPAIVKFQKELQFNKEFYLRISINIIDIIVSIAAVLILRSAIGIVYGLIAGAITEVLISFIFIKPSPKFSFEYEKAKQILSRGGWITAYGIFNYLFEHGDDIVVGKLLNSTFLGFYQVAYRISSLPLSEIGVTFNQVAFPVISNFADDKKRLKSAFLKTIIAVSLIVIPFGLVIFIYPEEVIIILLGKNWLEAVNVLKILAFFGAYKAISTFPHNVFLALKKQEYVTQSHFVGMVGMGILVVPLVINFGIVGAGIAAVFGAIASSVVTFYYTYKIFST